MVDSVHLYVRLKVEGAETTGKFSSARVRNRMGETSGEHSDDETAPPALKGLAIPVSSC